VTEDLDAYAEDLRQEVLSGAHVEGSEQMRDDVFAEMMIDVLIEAGEVENANVAHFGRRGAGGRAGVEIRGYGIDDADTLNLFVTRYSASVPPDSLTRTDAATAFRRLRAFWELCRDEPLHEQLDPSSPAYDMAEAVHRVAPEIRRVRMFLITDARSAADQLDVSESDGVEYRASVWDIVRLHRLESAGRDREPIEIDFVKRFGRPLPCLGADDDQGDYRAMLAIVPAPWLADIYEEHGARLLELNVRSFLQASGKVNRGIRDTLRDEPERFLAYNNGISATAGDVSLVTLPGGAKAIASIRDLQIVNGGQTTASVHRAMLNKIDLADAAVQAKITVAAPGQLTEIVPLISRYANSQNKVSEADLSANEPYHVEIEQLSRSVWTPVVDGSTRQTHWFYERARGQYRDAVFRAGTPPRQREFRLQNPPDRRFSKTDLAKFEQTWDQCPHEVSRGAQKNFTLFMGNLARRNLTPDRDYFQALVAKAILWKVTERLATAQKLGGYRANLVAYAIAKLSHATSQRLDLTAIWERQSLSPATEEALVELIHGAWDVIVGEAPTGTNITEWAKREDCWRLMRSRAWTPPSALDADLRRAGAPSEAADPAGGDAATAAVVGVGADGWYALEKWAKQTASLPAWQRTVAHDIGTRLAGGRATTPRQTQMAQQILLEASRLGYVP
jgi:hypothetical protein